MLQHEGELGAALQEMLRGWGQMEIAPGIVTSQQLLSQPLPEVTQFHTVNIAHGQDICLLTVKHK